MPEIGCRLLDLSSGSESRKQYEAGMKKEACKSDVDSLAGIFDLHLRRLASGGREVEVGKKTWLSLGDHL